MATAERACFQHPDIAGGTLQCTTCGNWACGDCRGSDHAGGVPKVVCATCGAERARKAMVRRAARIALIAAAITIVVGVYVSPFGFLVMVPIGLVFMYFRLRYYAALGSSGMGFNPFGPGSSIRRFLR